MFAAVARVLPAGQRRVTVIEWRQSRHRLALDHSSPSMGVWRIQCFWKDCRLPGSFRESAYWSAVSNHQVSSKLWCSLRARLFAHVEDITIVLGAGHVGQVVKTADVINGVVQLLRTHSAALDVAKALGPAVVIRIKGFRDVFQIAHREVVHLVAEAIIAGPPPEQGDGIGELDRLVGVEVVADGSVRVGSAGVMPEPDGTVGHRLVVTTPEPSLRMSEMSRRARR